MRGCYMDPENCSTSLSPNKIALESTNLLIVNSDYSFSFKRK